METETSSWQGSETERKGSASRDTTTTDIHFCSSARHLQILQSHVHNCY